MPETPAWAETLLLLVFVPVLSWAAFVVFSGPQRVAADLPSGAAEEAAEASGTASLLPLGNLFLARHLTRILAGAELRVV